ncbi:hypothetical protein COCMIDRAFT_104187 [Bipolaris oryzae ATCC 44560]|uniref:NAD(P)-binding domain-containing protein n=1 Tax=Bipolaris oryzae ATCC 44560 TaxID=930090 RepID=W6YXE1_COCMI|nr:uncharacterized protein COCMIDRAFT_104187 [Bipolaris oryzae ATCC 44560]EUC42195.1 hypothetical protein COCMIDRAFT_104187 [Bipolaris oryzae ATCC 44560]
MTTAAVFGSTGAVGSHILGALIANESYVSIKTISRRLPRAQSSKLEAILEADTSKWGDIISKWDPKPYVAFNGIGTTRALAGGLENQRKIDHDLCIETAKASKAAGASIYVFISAGLIRSFVGRNLPYSKMKIGVEDAIRDLDFEHAIILRPGMIVGDRERPKSIFLETTIGNIHKISQGLQDLIGVDQKILGQAAVNAARIAREGNAPSKYWVLEQADIIKYGRDEWKDESKDESIRPSGTEL